MRFVQAQRLLAAWRASPSYASRWGTPQAESRAPARKTDAWTRKQREVKGEKGPCSPQKKKELT